MMQFILYLLGLFASFHIGSIVFFVPCTLRAVYVERYRLLARMPDKEAMQEEMKEIIHEYVQRSLGVFVACGLCGCILFTVLYF